MAYQFNRACLNTMSQFACDIIAWMWHIFLPTWSWISWGFILSRKKLCIECTWTRFHTDGFVDFDRLIYILGSTANRKQRHVNGTSIIIIPRLYCVRIWLNNDMLCETREVEENVILFQCATSDIILILISMHVWILHLIPKLRYLSGVETPFSKFRIRVKYDNKASPHPHPHHAYDVNLEIDKYS